MEKTKLSYIEFQVCSHCNLKCKGCGAFSNYAEEEFADLEQYQKDMRRLSEIFVGGVERIHLMGGEPFLNPQLGEFINIARRTFKESNIHIITNGILIPQIADDVLEKVKECDAVINITKYPPTAALENKIRKRLDLFRIRYKLGEGNGEIVRKFFKNKNIMGTEDKEKAFEKCFGCYVLKNGILAQCGLPVHARANFKKYFDFEFMSFLPDRDFIDLYSTKLTGSDIISLFGSSKEFCKYCRIHNPEFFDWRITDKKIPDIYDWSV